MKKIFFSILLAAGVTSVGHAQGVRFGLKAGANLTSIVGKDTDDTKYKFGFHGGGVAEVGITKSFAIQPEVLFSMKERK